MEQTAGDWGDWPISDQNDIDAIIDAYQSSNNADGKENDTSAMKEDTAGQEGGDEEDDSATEESEEESDEEEFVEDVKPTVIQNGSDAHYYYHSKREGLATCEFCGRVGIKHAFYSKSKRFCSLACSRSFSASAKDSKGQRRKADGSPVGTVFPKKKQPQTLIQNKPDPSSFDWSEYLNETGATAAPVSCFKHCPMSDSWENIMVGMKVEVLNTNCNIAAEVYWIATVIKLSGYRALMRYEGFGDDPVHDFWINMCKQDVHPVGWCATNKLPLVPPQAIQHKYADWKEVLVKRLTGARTLPNNFYSDVIESIEGHPIKKGMQVEVVDKNCVSAMRVATVEEVIGGRLRFIYQDAKIPGEEFWCHRESPLLHPTGWSESVGHSLHASDEYKAESLNKSALNKYAEKDTTPEMFLKKRELGNGLKFQAGMKIEAIDPLNLSTICVATVTKVLGNNYLMIGIDGSIAENGTDWFCYHATSPCVFPVGFCEINELDLTPPRGYKGEFRWFDYLKQTRSLAAPVKLFDKEIPKHGFKAGMKLEAVDLMEPRLVCVATVVKVVGRLLRIHFDGWESHFDQWIDCQSPDIYPVGWCEMVHYHLEGPKPRELQRSRSHEASDNPTTHHPFMPRKRKSKSQIYRGPRKKKKVPTATLR